MHAHWLLMFVALLSGTQFDERKWIEVNRVLYASYSELAESPYRDSIKVHEKAFTEAALKLFAAGEVDCILPLEVPPVIYVRTAQGDSIRVREYLTTPQSFPQNLQLNLSFDVSWTGKVERVELLRYRGDGLEKIDFDDFVKHLVATPAERFGFPESVKKVQCVIRKK